MMLRLECCRFIANFLLDLKDKTLKDDISTGAAALTFYLFLSIFPAMIFLLALLPYLPIDNLDQLIMNLVGQILPKEAATLFSGIIQEVTTHQDSGLISFGFFASIWSASTGMSAIMEQLNKTQNVTEDRPFLKARAVALLMTLVFGFLIISSVGLVVFGSTLQSLLARLLNHQGTLLVVFAILRWMIVLIFLLLGFALFYYLGPNTKNKFRLVTVGGIVGVFLLIVASLGFRYYVDSFANYAATYGSLGAVIVLMFWLYMGGAVLLFGSEINFLVENRRLDNKTTSSDGNR